MYRGISALLAVPEVPRGMKLPSLLALLLLGCPPVDLSPKETGEGEPEESAPPAETGGADSGESGEPDSGETADSGESAETGETGQVQVRLPALFINEILASNVFSRVDELEVGELRSDLVELYNAGEEALSLGGLCITDDLEDPCKHALSDALSVPAGGHLLLLADGLTELGPTHLGFSLEVEGESLGLFLADGTPVDQLRFGAQLADWSAARAPDGGTTWVVGVTPSPEASNGEGEGAPDAPGAAVEEVPAAEDLSELYYDPEEAIEVGVELSEEAIEALADDPYSWVEGAFTHEGRRYAPVGVRVKGENSYLPITQKASLKVSFDRYVDGGVFLGMEEITLNNMSNDYSMMHERVAYWMYRAAGVPAARANHAWVTMNGDGYGLFTNVETVNEDLIRRWYTNPDGTLFEVHDVDFKDAYIEDFTLEYGPDDREALQAVADAMELEGALAVAAAAERLDWESYLAYWAVGAVVGQYDAYPYGVPGDDCHVFLDPEDGRLDFLPHGVDETFYSESYPVTAVYGVLSTRCLEDPSCEARFVELIWAFQEIAEDAELYAFAARVREQIERLAVADPNRPYEMDTVEAYQDAMLEFIEERSEDLEDQLGPRP